MGHRTLHDRRVLITGASGGIGRALALQLAPFNTKLMLVARREDELQRLADELARRGAADIVPIAGDLTDTAVRGRALEHVAEQWGGLDVLINNAGISAHGRFEQSSADVLSKIMDVNFFAAAELVRDALPQLRAGDDAVLVNIGSILGHRGVPYNSEYCASKFALRGWSEAIRPELARDGIALMIVSPGTTNTEFFEHLIAQGDKPPWGEKKGLPPDAVARQIVRGIERRRYEIYPNWRGRLLVLTSRLAPWLLDRVMNRYG